MINTHLEPEVPNIQVEQAEELLAGPASTDLSGLNRRIDFILFENGWEPEKADLVGEEQDDRTSTGLWPSDHAGVSGMLHLPCECICCEE